MSAPKKLIVERDARKRAVERDRFGRILLSRRLLSLRQLMRVLAIQADEPDTRLDAIAVREGFVSRKALVSALDS